jgi:hypothetical protein
VAEVRGGEPIGHAARPTGSSERQAGDSQWSVIVAERIETEIHAREGGTGDGGRELTRILHVAETERDVDPVEFIAVEPEYDGVHLVAAGRDAAEAGGADVVRAELVRSISRPRSKNWMRAKPQSAAPPAVSLMRMGVAIAIWKRASRLGWSTRAPAPVAVTTAAGGGGGVGGGGGPTLSPPHPGSMSVAAAATRQGIVDTRHRMFMCSPLESGT